MADGAKLRAAGEFAKAIQKFTAAADLARQIKDVDRQSIALRQSAVCYASVFDYRKTVQFAQEAFGLAMRAKDDTSAGAAAGVLSSTYRLLGDFSAAEKQGDIAIHLLRNSPQRELLVRALLTEAALKTHEGITGESVASAERAVQTAHQANLPLLEGFACDFSGILLLLQSKLPEAERALHEATAIQTKLHDSDELAVTHEHLAGTKSPQRRLRNRAEIH